MSAVAAAKLLNGDLQFGTVENTTGVFTAFSTPVTYITSGGTAAGNVQIYASTITLGSVGTNLIKILGDLAIRDDANALDKFTVDNNTGNTVIQGTLGVTNAATLSNNLTVQNTTTLGGGAAGTDYQYNTTVKGKLFVNGAASGATTSTIESATQAISLFPSNVVTVSMGNASTTGITLGHSGGGSSTTTTIYGNLLLSHLNNAGSIATRALAGQATTHSFQKSDTTEIGFVGKIATEDNLYINANSTNLIYLTTGGSANKRVTIDSAGKIALFNSTVDGTYNFFVNGTTRLGGTTSIDGTLTTTGTFDTTLGGDININGGDLKTTASTFNLLESGSATTVNLAGTASVGTYIGHTTGPVYHRGPAVINADKNVTMTSGLGTFLQTYAINSATPTSVDAHKVIVSKAGNVTGAETVTGVSAVLTRTGTISTTGTDQIDKAGYFEIAGSVANSGTGITKAYAIHGKAQGSAEVLFAGYFEGGKVAIDGTTASTAEITTVTGTTVQVFNAAPVTTFQAASSATTIEIGKNSAAATAISIGSTYSTIGARGITTINNNLTVTGDLIVNGTTTTVNTSELSVSDNLITLNSDYAGSSPSENAGVEVERGTLTNATVLWNETGDRWTIDKEAAVGTMQVIATRQDSPTDTGVAYWNNTEKRFDVDTDSFTYVTGSNTLTVANVSSSGSIITTGTGTLTVAGLANFNGGVVNLGAATTILTAASTGSNTNAITIATGNATVGANLSGGTLLLKSGSYTGNGTSNIEFWTNGRVTANQFALQINRDGNLILGSVGNTSISQLAPAVAGTAGYSHTITASPAAPNSTTSYHGGNLIIQSGQSAGVTGTSSVVIQTPTPGSQVGPALNTLADRVQINSAGLGLKDTINASYWQYIKSASTGIAADRTLTVNTNNADRTIDIQGNITTTANVSITGALTTSAAFTTTGNFTTSLTQGANITLILPVVSGLTIATLTGTEVMTNKTLVAPKISNVAGNADSYLADYNGNELVDFGTVTSAQNNIKISNAASAGTPKIESVGSVDTNIHLDISAKGTGDVRILTGSQLLVQDSTTSTTTTTGALIVTGGAGIGGTLSTASIKLLETGSAPTYYTTLQSGDLGAARTLTLPDGTVGGYIATTGNTTGIVDVANGGTNIVTYTTYDMLYASAATTLNKLSVPGTPDGEVLMIGVGAGQGLPRWAKVSGANMSNVSSTNTASNIVLRAANGAFSTGEITITKTLLPSGSSTGNLNVAGDAVITGNLTVNGTTTTVNTATLNISDNLITVNSDYAGSSPSENGGIEVERGTLTNASILWDETADLWKVDKEGAVGTMQIVATRSALSTANAVAYWDNTNKLFTTDTDSLTYDASTNTLTVANVTGNASSATKWATARSIVWTAGVVDSATAGIIGGTSSTWDGTGNLTTTAAHFVLQSHAMTTTQFGAGTSANYGHVKITDSTADTQYGGGIISTSGALKLNFTTYNSGNYGTALTVARGDHTHLSAGITDATDANTASKIMERDANGYVSAARVRMGVAGAADKADMRWNNTSNAIEFVIY